MACLLLLAALGPITRAEERRARLLFDEYYQIDPGTAAFSQGVALDGRNRGLTYHYSPGVNALPNGTFTFAHVIADRFRLETSREPISETLLRSTDAYMLVSPIKPEFGGRAALTTRDADLLEAFVARGGMLVLILNSSSPQRNPLDWEGVNRVAARFGVEFLHEATGTLSVPIAPDDPAFDGVDAFIYGNGTTLRVSAAAGTPHLLIRDPREGDHAPIGVIVSHGRGRVLAFGDGGTFGNAHLFRSDLAHARAVRQMMEALLPNGPVPAYGWKAGQRLKVRLSHEQTVSGYPHRNRLLGLPVAAGSGRIVAEPRDVDLAGFADKEERKSMARYLTSLHRDTTTLTLVLGERARDGKSHAVEWKADDGKTSLAARLLPGGRTVDLSPGASALATWQWALSGELLLGSLRPWARPGDVWPVTAPAALPHAQLHPVPTLRPASGTLRFDGEVERDGVPCYLFTRTLSLEGRDARLDDFVLPEVSSRLGNGGVEMLSWGTLLVTQYWIRRDTLLPLRTELRASGALWWFDRDFPRRYEGTHDWRNFETWRNVNFVATFGRLLVADFAVE
ncbi:MAG: hypothetical protein FJ382_10410 [Verrucomicrobia bacterium]|nr:hypothetical protein [Verrucomicrobiota bacterium]